MRSSKHTEHYRK